MIQEEKKPENIEVLIEEEIDKFKMLMFEQRDELRTRLKNYIFNASGVVSNYVAQRKIFIEINLTIMIVLATFFGLIFKFLTDINTFFILAFIGLIIYLFISMLNIIYNLTEHRTFNIKLYREDFWKTNWFYRNHVPETEVKNKCLRKIINFFRKIIKILRKIKNKFFKRKDSKEIELELIKNLNDFADNFKLHSNNKSNNSINKKNESKSKEINEKKKDNKTLFENQLIRDDIKNLYKLYIYESNYYSIAKGTRIITLVGLIIIIIYYPIILLFL